jgi:hypothetical protein
MNTSREIAFDAKRPLPWSAFVWLAVGLLLLLIIRTSPDHKPGAECLVMVPLAGLAASLMGRPKRVRGVITDDKIVWNGNTDGIPFEIAMGLSAPGRNPFDESKSFTIRLYHMAGVLTIPRNVDIGSETLFDELLSRMPVTLHAKTYPNLSHYYMTQNEMFGSDRVFSFVALPDRARSEKSAAWFFRRFSLVLGFFAVLSMIGAELILEEQVADQVQWLSGGVTAYVIMIFILSFIPNSPGVKDWQFSSLVVSPVGIAMSQGDVTGELLWHQLLDVKYKIPRGDLRWNGSRSHARGLQLVVEGVSIGIADIYQYPLTVIQGQIHDYWQHGQGGDADLEVL